MSFDPRDRPLSPPADWPAPPTPETAGQAPGPAAGPSRRRRWRPLIHLLLFLGTLVTTMAAGIGHYAGFAGDPFNEIPDLSLALIPYGAWYSLTILAILGTHEFGHYFACRYYGIDASLPYFLPAPLPLTGTVGAVIRIRQPIPTKRMLFDIGAAGPIAGFVVAVPALFLGLRLSRVVPLPDDFVGMELGEPLLFQLAAWMVWGEAPTGHSINLHPMGLAAWLGLLVTALNLFPVGQLDGGHIAYAALGRGPPPSAWARPRRRRPRVLFDELGDLGGAHHRHDRVPGPAPSAHRRRGRAARPQPPVGRPGDGRDLRPLLHARTDRGAGPGARA